MISLLLPAHPRLRSILLWGMTLVWAGLIFYLSTRRFDPGLSGWLLTQLLLLLHVQVSPAAFALLHLLLRKLAHLTEYAIFSLFLYHSLEGNRPHAWRLRRACLAVLVAGLYALSDELHQHFVRGRNASPIDAGIDTLGAAAGMLVLYMHDLFLQVNSSSTAAESARMEEIAKGVAGE